MNFPDMEDRGLAGCTQEATLRPPTLTETVERQLVQAKAEVERLTELKKLLSENKDITRIMELMGGRKY